MRDKVSPNQRHVVAYGGDNDRFEINVALDNYALSLCERPTPRVCYLPTASGDNPQPIVDFYRAFHEAGRADCTHISLFNRATDPRDPEQVLLNSDLVLVGGGAVANLLAVWRVHGLDHILRSAWRRGVVLAGYSAGAICWFDGGITTSYGQPPSPVTGGLGIISGSFCPHSDSQPARSDELRRALTSGSLACPAYAVGEGAGLHFNGDGPPKVIGINADVPVCEVDTDLVETRAPVDVLVESRLG